MKYLVRFIEISVLMLGVSILTSCYSWVTTVEGHKVWSNQGSGFGTKHYWSGSANSDSYADGQGTMRVFHPDPLFGDVHLTYEGVMKGGKFVDNVDFHNNKRGSYFLVYKNGEIAEEIWQPSKSSGRSSSGGEIEASDLLGALFAGAGFASGDSVVAGAGMQMMAGDASGAINQLQNSNASAGGIQPGSTPSPSRPVTANEPNLIDSYGLGRFRTSNGDHITYYIKAADRSYQDYRKSGNADYYKRHREYADLARQFHKQT